MEAPVAVGIDLGATNCLVAVFRQGRVEIMENLSHGNRFTPSFVCYNNNKILVGQAAKNSFLKNEGNSIYNVKRLIGRNFDDPIVQDSMKELPYILVDDDNNKIKCVVIQNDKKIIFTPVDIYMTNHLQIKD